MTNSFLKTIEGALQSELDEQSLAFQAKIDELEAQNLGLTAQISDLEGRLAQISQVSFVEPSSSNGHVAKRSKKGKKSKNPIGKAAKQLKTIRETHGLSNTELGELLGVSASYISAWMGGHQKINVARATDIAKLAKKRTATITRLLNQ